MGFVADVREFVRSPIIIGPPDCPILYRWAVFGGGSQGRPLFGKRDGFPFSVKVHHFPSNADDRDLHNHPWPFVTVVLRGGYDDLVACPYCDGTGERSPLKEGWARAFGCNHCRRTGMVLGDRMRAGMIRYRGPEHRHRTRASVAGCWTLVVTGPKVPRSWGFFRDGRFWPWREYEKEFGFAMRCEDLDEEYRPR